MSSYSKTFDKAEIIENFSIANINIKQLIIKTAGITLSCDENVIINADELVMLVDLKITASSLDNNHDELIIETNDYTTFKNLHFNKYNFKQYVRFIGKNLLYGSYETDKSVECEGILLNGKIVEKNEIGVYNFKNFESLQNDVIKIGEKHTLFVYGQLNFKGNGKELYIYSSITIPSETVFNIESDSTKITNCPKLYGSNNITINSEQIKFNGNEKIIDSNITFKTYNNSGYLEFIDCDIVFRTCYNRNKQTFINCTANNLFTNIEGELTAMNCVFYNNFKISHTNNREKVQLYNTTFLSNNVEKDYELNISNSCLIYDSTIVLSNNIHKVRILQCFSNIIMDENSYINFNGKLSITQPCTMNKCQIIYNGYFGDASLTINTKKELTGIIEFYNTAKDSLSLTLNSTCSVNIPYNSTIKIMDSTNVVLNGTLKSTIENETYSFSGNHKINGIIEIYNNTNFGGNLTISNNGKLIIGKQNQILSETSVFNLTGTMTINGTCCIYGTLSNAGNMIINGLLEIHGLLNNTGTINIKNGNKVILYNSMQINNNSQFIVNGDYNDSYSKANKLTISGNTKFIINGFLTLGYGDIIPATINITGPNNDNVTLSIIFNGTILCNKIIDYDKSQTKENITIQINTNKDLDDKLFS